MPLVRFLLYKLLKPLDGYKLYRDFTFTWKKNRLLPPHPTQKGTPNIMRVAKAMGWEEEQKGPCWVHLSPGLSGPLRSALGHWGAHQRQSTGSGTKDAHSTPHRNWEGHHQAQTPRWRGLGVYASSRWWQVRGWGTCVGDPLDPQPLHLQTDTQEEIAGRAGQDRHKVRQTDNTCTRTQRATEAAPRRRISQTKVMGWKTVNASCFRSH